MDDEARQTKAWVENWKRAGQALDAIRAEELQALDRTNYLEQIDGMLQWAVEHAEPRLTSGLVEQQRIFATLRSPK